MIVKAVRKFSSLEVWQHFRKSRSLEVWKSGGLKKQFWRNFTCPDFITLQASKLLSFQASCKGASAFTMAEILISLTIIGVIAAITLPSLRANINESAWTTQRKALYSRLSQAIAMLPSLNGYGEYEGTWNNNVVTVTKDTAAQAFVTEGLSKVLKITNVCDNNNLQNCGLPAKYMKFNGSKADFPKNMEEFNQYFVHTSAGFEAYANPQKNINTNAVAFETVNGEHVAVFYNPMCANREMKFVPNENPAEWTDPQFIYPYMCATFLFDLNGKKGPNRMGKDMWFITSLYSVEPSVVMFNPDKLTKYSTNTMSFNDAKRWCAGQDARLANVDEGIAGKLSGQGVFGWLGTDTGISNMGYIISTSGTLIKTRYSNSFGVRCIKR